MRPSFAFIIFLPHFLLSQNRINPDFQYVDHLSHAHNYKDALDLLRFEKTRFHEDTLNFLMGYNYHFLRKPDSSAFYLSKVPENSNFYYQALSYGSLNYLYGKKYSEAGRQLQSALRKKNLEDDALLSLMLGGKFLLERNYKSLDSLAPHFKFNDYRFSQEQEYLLLLNKNLQLQKRKSPLVAGMLSAVVPGSGKFYAGKKGAGLAAFLCNMALAGFVAESYYRSGYKSPQFITFGSMFLCFYTGNILGSVYSVKQQIRSTNGKINNEILATIHIPITRVFNE
jgi:hypothetical protein